VTATRSFYTSDVYAEHYLGIRWPRAVWSRVLEQAVADIVDDPSPYFKAELARMDAALRREIRAAAEHWIADDANEPRRFVWVCEQLGLEVAAVRRSIEKRRGR
jgi:hypothetical protein